jgi:hypothetical protein
MKPVLAVESVVDAKASDEPDLVAVGVGKR